MLGGRLLAPYWHSPVLANDVARKLSGSLFVATLSLRVEGDRAVASEALRQLASPFAAFATDSAALKSKRRSTRFILSAAEAASLWHPPTETVELPRLASVESRLLAPPVNVPTVDRSADLAILGTTKGERLLRFGLLPEDRFRHLLVLGKSGMGKTTALHQLIVSDIAKGRGLTLIDPHGDLADSVLAHVPAARTNDVIAFDAGDPTAPVGFNPLACERKEDRPLVASGVVSAFRKMFAYSWGPRLEYWLRNAVLAMLETPGTTLLSLVQFLNDPRYRESILDRVDDPIIRVAWGKEFAALPVKLQVEALAPILNKVGTYATSPQLRAIVGDTAARLSLDEILDRRKVLIVNLSKGRLGEDASSLLGALLVTTLQVAVMRRARMPEESRVPH